MRLGGDDDSAYKRGTLGILETHEHARRKNRTLRHAATAHSRRRTRRRQRRPLVLTAIVVVHAAHSRRPIAVGYVRGACVAARVEKHSRVLVAALRVRKMQSDRRVCDRRVCENWHIDKSHTIICRVNGRVNQSANVQVIVRSSRFVSVCSSPAQRRREKLNRRSTSQPEKKTRWRL